MSIFNQYQNITLNSQQREAIEVIQRFFDSDESVFILKGYAGSGKTTLLRGIIKHLKSLNKQVEVMAPTGRAAKVLRDKTGHGKTIHSSIYNFEQLVPIKSESKNESEHSFKYLFPIRQSDDIERYIFVDESSMISSRESKNELFDFGTNILLNDVLTYAQLPSTKNKIIFVGDPAQLPPVGDNQSKALSKSFFNGLGLNVTEVTLSKVMRQEENLILANSLKMRQAIDANTVTELALDYDKSSYVNLPAENFANKYLGLFPSPELGDGVIISFSNAQSLNYNHAIRKQIFPGGAKMESGDILMVVNNNYHAYGTEIFNGDMIKVMSVDNQKTYFRHVPVFVDKNGSRVKEIVKLEFNTISFRIDGFPEEIEALVLGSMLDDHKSNLSITEMRALYIDFVIRFNENQAKNRQNGQTSYKVGSEQFKEQLKTDPMFNALRIKYGYAITCHKAQGSEWETVFVDYYGRNILAKDPLRWCYTATTRASLKCYVANAPHFTVFSKLKFGTIGKLSNTPGGSYSFEGVPKSPFQNPDFHICKSAMYWEVMEKLENSDFKFKSLVSVSQYQERYTFSKDEIEYITEVYHNEDGTFKPFKCVSNENDELLHLLNEKAHILYSIHYNPELPFLKDLHTLVQSACFETNTTVTNIEERVSDFFVKYFIATQNSDTIIQFYFNGKNQLTRVMPKSTKGAEDQVLLNLIEKIESYVV